MKIPGPSALRSAHARRAMTLVEFMVAVLIGTIVLAVVGILFIFGLRSFLALANYSDLDNKSRRAIDLMSRDMRMASQVVAFQPNLPTLSLTLVNTNLNVGPVLTNTYTWDSVAGTMTSLQTGPGITNATTVTNLTGCDQWSFSLYQRNPQANMNNIFFPTSDPTLCKLISMTWKCSRQILGQKLNTESVQTAQVVLRNKQ